MLEHIVLKNKEKKGRTKRSSDRKTGSPASSLPSTPKAMMTPIAEFDQEQFMMSCKRIFNKPFESLPIHKDLGRLIKGAFILDNTGLESTVLFHCDGKNDSRDRLTVIRDFLVVLSRKIDTPEQAEWIEGNFPRNEKDDADMGVILNEFFEKLRAQPFPLQMLSILKCCNQEMPFGAVMVMKEIIGSNFSYQDVRGTWKVSVTFNRQETVVSHHKMEQSLDNTDENYFVFAWNLDLRFCCDLTTFIPVLGISDFEFGARVNGEAKKMITSSLEPFLSPVTEYYRIWKKTLSVKSSHLRSDLHQFSNKILVTNLAGKKLWKPNRSKNENENLKNIIMFLGEKLHDSPESVSNLLAAISIETNESLGNFLAKSGTRVRQPSSIAIAQMTNTIKSETVNEEFPHLWSVLKCSSSEMLSPPLMQMRNSFYDKVPFLDVRGSWRIHIKIEPGEPVTVIHRKEELNDNIGLLFEWVVSITLSRSFQRIEKVDFRINDYRFTKPVSEETKELVKNCLRPFYQPFPDDFPIDIPPEVALKLIISRLKSEEQRFTVHSQELPFSIGVIRLLSDLQSSFEDPDNPTSQRTKVRRSLSQKFGDLEKTPEKKFMTLKLDRKLFDKDKESDEEEVVITPHSKDAPQKVYSETKLSPATNPPDLKTHSEEQLRHIPDFDQAKFRPNRPFPKARNNL
eukprot:TRINITY_DN3789_c0_g1_i1.p1 TRINITY_DN3789_c0_g1~~TRINITY_DN3789_c0_g1_i1.p1  ORF type:complete len:682 (+),score=166.81 TRINITY_DN3789_c0_g1_i1:95-2140(+)